jgi:Flp pilus assembly protein TadB
MTKRQKDRQHNDQKTEGQTTQLPKDRRIYSTMTKRQKNRQLLYFCHCVVYSSVFWSLCCLFFCLLVIVLSIILSFGHCVVYSSVFWSLCCLFFCILVIVLSILLSFGHCVVYYSVFWSLCCLLFCLLVIGRKDNTMTKRQKDRQHNDQNTEE